MKLHKALKLSQEQRKRKPIAPPVETDPFVKIKLACEICGSDTGQTKDIRSTLIGEQDMKDMGINPKSPVIREGLCPRCYQHLASGLSAVVNKSGTKSCLLNERGTMKWPEEKRGKIIGLTDEEYDKYILGIGGAG